MRPCRFLQEAKEEIKRNGNGNGDAQVCCDKMIVSDDIGVKGIEDECKQPRDESANALAPQKEEQAEAGCDEDEGDARKERQHVRGVVCTEKEHVSGAPLVIFAVLVDASPVVLRRVKMRLERQERHASKRFE